MKKILLYLVAILTPFVFISGANAGSGFSRENFFMPSQIHYFNCSTSTNCTTDLSVYGSAQDGYFNGAVALGTAGIYIRFVSNVEFKQDYMYSIQSIVCFDGNTSLNPTGKYYPGYNQFNNVIWQRETTSYMDTYDPVTDTTYDVCKLITSIVVPDTNSPYVGLHITNSTKYSNINVHFLGYYVEGLGMYSESMKDYIDDAIGNSGYATAASVEEVEDSINSMKSAITSAQNTTNNKLDTSIKEQQETNDKLQSSIEEQEKTNDALTSDSDDESSSSCGMICKLKNILSYINPLSDKFFAYKLVELLIDALKSLIVPDDMSFVTDFVDALESKLGFIGAIPGQIIEFAINLVSASWSEFDSISFPSISIFGYNFWNSQEIDLTEAINIFKPFKYVTDCICVVLCARTLNKWREQFTGGSSE